MRRDDTPAGVDTGRLTTGLAPEAHEIVYDRYTRRAGDDGDAVAEELRFISEVDQAHLVMLADHGIVAPEAARALLGEIRALREADFAPVCRLPIPRGVYLAYEHHLIEQLGDGVGGMLHTGRSRNDLNATTARLRTRQPYRELLDAVDRLAEALLTQSERYRNVAMPAYTHGQPAVPITYGHYLAGMAAGVVRGQESLVQAGEEIESNPLGAGAVGGTSVPIDVRQTTDLLGFAEPVVNSVDAVASRDFALRLLGAATVLANTVTRAARDLSIWTSEEFCLLRVADDLVGSSSMMPQKRNPFLLEHVSGRAAVPLGCLVAASTAMGSAGWTNAIAVGTEAMRHLAPGLRALSDAVTLLRLFVLGVSPDEDRMAARCADGFTSATYLAERLVLGGVPFRSAHHRVGRAVLAATANGTALDDTVTPDAVVRACAYGAGPGTDTRPRLRARLDRCRRNVNERTRRWRYAAARLDEAVDRLLRPTYPA